MRGGPRLHTIRRKPAEERIDNRLFALDTERWFQRDSLDQDHNKAKLYAESGRQISMACVAAEEGRTENTAREEHMRIRSNHAKGRLGKFNNPAGSKGGVQLECDRHRARQMHPPYPMRAGRVPIAARGVSSHRGGSCATCDALQPWQT